MDGVDAQFRIALLASCVAFPAVAQTTVPKLNNGDQAAAQAQTSAQIAAAQAQAVQEEARMQAQQAGSSTGGQRTVPRVMPPALDPIGPNKPLTQKEAINVSVAGRWISRFQRPHLDDDGVEHFTAGRGEVQVVAAVDHITDIALGAGEIIAPPLHFGDESGWWGHVAVSGSGRNVISHVLIKPKDSGLFSNL